MSAQEKTEAIRDKSTISLSEIFADPTILEERDWGCCKSYGHEKSTLKNKLYGVLPKLKWMAEKGMINPDILGFNSHKWQGDSWQFELVNIEKRIIVLVLHPESRYFHEHRHVDYAKLSIYNIDADDIEPIRKLSYQSVKRYRADPYRIEHKGDRRWQRVPHAWISKCNMNRMFTYTNIFGSTWSDIKKVLENDQQVAELVKKYANKTEYNNGTERPERQPIIQAQKQLDEANEIVNKLITEGGCEKKIEDAEKVASNIIDDFNKAKEEFKSEEEYRNETWPKPETFNNPKYFLQ